MITEREILENCACHKARTAARAITRAYDEALRPVGLRARQRAVLGAGAMDAAIPINALAHFMGMDRTTLPRNLGPLEKEGLVTLGIEGWRRSRALTITKKGRSRLREALPLWSRAQQALRKQLGDRNWEVVHNALDHLIHAAA